MKKTNILLLVLLFAPIVFAQNETINDTTNQSITNQTWYGDFTSEIMQGDNLTMLTIIIGLVLVYLLGKIAFKLIKWAIIILAIILVLKILIF